MSDITCDCAADLELVRFPCKALDYGFPTKLVLMRDDGTLAVVGESPTVAEIQTGLGDTGSGKLVLIEELTNGQRVEDTRQEESGADTADGLTDVFSVNMAITGRIKKLSEAVRTNLAQLNCFARLRVWIITNTGYIFGGATGYKCSNFNPPMNMPGFGSKSFYDMKYVYAADNSQNDPAAQDDDYLTLQNPTTT